MDLNSLPLHSFDTKKGTNTRCCLDYKSSSQLNKRYECSSILCLKKHRIYQPVNVPEARAVYVVLTERSYIFDWLSVLSASCGRISETSVSVSVSLCCSANISVNFMFSKGSRDSVATCCSYRNITGKSNKLLMTSNPRNYSDVHELTAGPPLFLKRTPSARSALAVSSNSVSGLTSPRLSNSLYFITNLHKHTMTTKYFFTQKRHYETHIFHSDYATMWVGKTVTYF